MNRPSSRVGLAAAALSRFDLPTEYGWDAKVPMAFPLLFDASDATVGGRENRESLAAGAALAGVTFVCDELLRGDDPATEFDANGRVGSAPGVDGSIEAFRRHQRGLGEILVRIHVADARFAAAEYLVEKHGLTSVELTWGRRARGVNGSVRIDDVERAAERKRRGDIVTPNPDAPAVRAAFRDGAFREFVCHERLGLIDREGFLAECDRLRRLGFERIALRVPACEPSEAAMALRWSSQARIDLVTVAARHGDPAATCAAFEEEADRLIACGRRVPDLAVAGPFGSVDEVFETILQGAPRVKAVCIGPTLPVSDECSARSESLDALVGAGRAEGISPGAAAVRDSIGRFGARLRRLAAPAPCSGVASPG